MTLQITQSWWSRSLQVGITSSRRFHFTFRYLKIILLLDEFSAPDTSGSYERIHFQRHPGQSGEFHHLVLEEYEQRLSQSPKIRHWSDDLEQNDFNSDTDNTAISPKSQICGIQEHQSELPLLSCVSETRTNEVESHHSQQSPNKRVSVPQVEVTWNIPESSNDTVVLVVDDARSPALDATAIPHFTLSGPHTLGGINLYKNETREFKIVQIPLVRHKKTALVRTLQSSLVI